MYCVDDACLNVIRMEKKHGKIKLLFMLLAQLMLKNFGSEKVNIVVNFYKTTFRWAMSVNIHLNTLQETHFAIDLRQIKLSKNWNCTKTATTIENKITLIHLFSFRITWTIYDKNSTPFLHRWAKLGQFIKFATIHFVMGVPNWLSLQIACNKLRPR
jgi:hypothetical protein